jgi:hypothetical protein
VSTIGVLRCQPWRATYAARVMPGDRAPARRSFAERMRQLVRNESSAPLASLSVAAAVVVIGTFLPWLRTGSTSRSSYDLLALLSRLDIAPDGVVSTSVRWWPLVPLLVTAAVVAAWWRWTWIAVVAAAISALYAGGVATAMMVASQQTGGATGIRLGPGPWVCAIGSLDVLVSATWLAITNARDPAAPALDAAVPDGRS